MPPGAIVKELRDAKGWSQSELAERVGHIDASGVSKIETGKDPLGRQRALRFARVFGVSVSLLLPPSEARPSLQQILDHLQALEAKVELLTGNQERLVALVERLVGGERRVGGGPGSHSERPQVSGPFSPSE